MACWSKCRFKARPIMLATFGRALEALEALSQDQLLQQSSAPSIHATPPLRDGLARSLQRRYEACSRTLSVFICPPALLQGQSIVTATIRQSAWRMRIRCSFLTSFACPKLLFEMVRRNLSSTFSLQRNDITWRQSPRPLAAEAIELSPSIRSHSAPSHPSCSSSFPNSLDCLHSE